MGRPLIEALLCLSVVGIYFGGVKFASLKGLFRIKCQLAQVYCRCDLKFCKSANSPLFSPFILTESTVARFSDLH